MHGRQDAEATTGVVDALEAATRAIASLQTVDDVLQVIVDQVRLLVRADYAALGTVRANGVIERFITSPTTTSATTPPARSPARPASARTGSSARPCSTDLPARLRHLTAICAVN